jgi:hypothetical protein
MSSILKELFKWSGFQIASLCAAFISAIGISITIVVFTVVIFNINSPALTNLLDYLFFPVIILKTMFVYALVWYYFYFHAYQEQRLIHAAICSSFPTIVLTILWLPFVTQPVDPYSCSLLPDRLVFYCLLFSFILLPIYAYMLNKLVYPVKNKQKRMKYLLLVWLLMLTIVTGMLTVISFFVDHLWYFMLG